MMRFAAIPPALGVLLLALSAAPAGAQPALSDSAAAELARRIDLLARELDDLRLGEVAAPPTSRHGLGPAASKVYGVERGVSIGGYGEMLATGYAAEREDGQPAGRSSQIDFLRQIVYVGYKFDDRLLVNSEIEFEHASTDESGSVSVEFATVEALLRPEANLRAGLVLVPMGLVNEMHEPPVFLGTLRPETERRIVPSTWRANGAGAFGEAGGLEYRAYVIESLDAEGFDGSGLRGGRQHGSRALFEDAAGVARLEYARSGIRAAGSVFHGATAQGRTVSGSSFAARTTIWEAHLDAHTRGVRLRALVAGAAVGDAAQVNDLRGIVGDGGGASVGSRQLGWYVEGGYDLVSRLAPGSRYEFVPYFRYEEIDTQRSVPDGYTRDPANDDRITTAGASFYPHPQVVVKADYQWLRDAARTGTNQWNAVLGYLF
jgi:hypothetical protein